MTLEEIIARQKKRTERDGWRSPLVQDYYDDVSFLLTEVSKLQGLILEMKMHYAAKTTCQCGKPLSTGSCRIYDNDD